MSIVMASGLYRPDLSRPAAVHVQCGSWRYRPARDAVPRSAAQSRPATCTSLGGTGPRDSDLHQHLRIAPARRR
ncbi:hypothetical protein F2Q69_00000511 [Brassica cretica]|uniref:Uncharacterized protein n=1 Tax=Brassica cretica TaxID=69181 RepID=A0A8S9PLZ6_BRACR|nr:hypothetical protein F2Q69_00000511 [Brassica cretica]